MIPKAIKKALYELGFNWCVIRKDQTTVLATFVHYKDAVECFRDNPNYELKRLNDD